MQLHKPATNSAATAYSATIASSNNNQANINNNQSNNPQRIDPKSSLLLINTNNMLITCSSTSSPSATSSATTASSVRHKTAELKLSKEIERLEALCESRTKELSMLKLTLKKTIISFDAIGVAFKYLSGDVSLEIPLY